VLKWNVPSPSTVYWTSPGSFTAQCVDSDGAHVLMVTPRDGGQTPTPAPTPAWGLHLLDANLSQGNLIADVKSETAAYLAHGGT
jgi:hypothetical protein